MGEAEPEDKDVSGDQQERGADADLDGDVLLPAAGLHKIAEPIRAFAVLSA